MKIKTTLGAIGLALTINSAQAGGIYRYHDSSISHRSEAIQSRFQAKKFKSKLRQQKRFRAYIRSQLKKQMNAIDDMEDSSVAIIHARRDLTKAERLGLKYQKNVWDRGINMPMIEIPDPYQNRTSIKRVDYR